MFLTLSYCVPAIGSSVFCCSVIGPLVCSISARARDGCGAHAHIMGSKRSLSDMKELAVADLAAKHSRIIESGMQKNTCSYEDSSSHFNGHCCSAGTLNRNRLR